MYQGDPGVSPPVPFVNSDVPDQRITMLADAEVGATGDYVLYWMTAYRRTGSNYALQRAADWSRHLGLPLVVLVALRLDYPWANDRIHAFAIDGIVDVVEALGNRPVVCVPYIEPEPGAGKGLLGRLSASAAVVVGDDAPVFFLPAARQAAVAQIECRFEVVDHNGVVPMSVTDREFKRAVDLRRFYQTILLEHLEDGPDHDPLGGLDATRPDVIDQIMSDYPTARLARDVIPELDLDHEVPVAPLRGGQVAARTRLAEFVASGLGRYDQRNHPDEHAESGLSPYLHFGHISVHEVLAEVVAAEQWTPAEVAPKATGSRAGWWGMSEQGEGFLDQIVTWRDIGYRAAYYSPSYDQYEALPGWARQTLEQHASDPRPYLYTPDELARAETHDDVWNAAQTQLTETGVMHNYLRMLWGKKILEWSPHPRIAHAVMMDLNNRYALDGRDPNSVSGIHWVLGRFDRAWGPEREIFGKVRYMTSDSTRRKLKLQSYLAHYQPTLRG